MKYVKLSWDTGWDSKTVLLAVIQNAQDGINYAEIKKRLRIIDVLEAVTFDDTWFQLEDADHQVLQNCINSFKFATATKGLAKVLEFVMEATNARPDTTGVSGTAGLPDERLPNPGLGATDTGGCQQQLAESRPANGKLDTSEPLREYVER